MGVKRYQLKVKSCWVWLFLLSVLQNASAFELPDDFLLQNEDVFAPEFFPRLEQQNPERVFFEGLVTLYPGRVLNHSPEILRPAAKREPLVEILPRGIRYVRVYDLEQSLQILAESTDSPALIWDFRYLYAPYAVSKSLLTMMAPIGFEPPAKLQKVGHFSDGHSRTSGPGPGPIEPDGATRVNYPAIVLVNAQTRGPVEAALDALQRNQAIMTIGTHTAGLTGSYKPAPHVEGFWVIQGEVRASGGPSLLGAGLSPEVSVNVSPEADFVGYQLLETGYDAADVLKIELPDVDTGADDEAEEALRPGDPVMQRAVEIIIALQVLGKLPPE